MHLLCNPPNTQGLSILTCRDYSGGLVIGRHYALSRLPRRPNDGLLAMTACTGAGDTVIATLGAAFAVKAQPRDAIRLANMAAGIVVGKLGAVAIDRNELAAAVA